MTANQKFELRKGLFMNTDGTSCRVYGFTSGGGGWVPDPEATAARHIRGDENLRAKLVAAGYGPLVDRLLAIPQRSADSPRPFSSTDSRPGAPDPAKPQQLPDSTGSTPGHTDSPRPPSAERVSRWLGRIHGSPEWSELEPTPGGPWLNLFSIYCESHIEAWYVDVDLLGTPIERKGPQKWIVCLGWPPHPEAGQRPPLCLAAESFRGICTAMHQELDLDVQELLDALLRLKVWDQEVADAATVWAEISD